MLFRRCGRRVVNSAQVWEYSKAFSDIVKVCRYQRRKCLRRCWWNHEFLMFTFCKMKSFPSQNWKTTQGTDFHFVQEYIFPPPPPQTLHFKWILLQVLLLLLPTNFQFLLKDQNKYCRKSAIRTARIKQKTIDVFPIAESIASQEPQTTLHCPPAEHDEFTPCLDTEPNASLSIRTMSQILTSRQAEELWEFLCDDLHAEMLIHSIDTSPSLHI